MKTVFALLFFSFLGNNSITAEKEYASSMKSEMNWYICASCCKTAKSESAPWTSGCKGSSSGTHNYQFCGKAGDFNYTCDNCDAEVYLTSSTSPAASKCCASGTHTWRHR